MKPPAIRQTVLLHRSVIQLLFEFIVLFFPVSFVYILVMGALRPTMLVTPPASGIVLWTYRSLVVLAFLEIVRRYFNTIYVLGPDRATRISGRLALKIQRFSIAYIDIREVKVNQTILGRLFDYGTVFLETAGKEIPELSLEYIASPKKIAKYVEKLRANVIKRMKGQETDGKTDELAEMRKDLQILEDGE